MQQSLRRIHPTVVALHWALAALVLLAVASIHLRGVLPSGHAWRPWLRHSHVFLGQLVFWLSVARLWVRMRHPVKAAEGVPVWSRVAARVSHALLYVVLVAQPVLGVLMQQTGGKEVDFLGLQMPILMAADAPTYFAIKKTHEFIAHAFLALLGLHVCAALWHHLVRKDSTLRDMLLWQRAADATAAPDAVRRRAVALVHAGCSPAQLAAQFGVSAAQIAGWVAQDAARRGAALRPPRDAAEPSRARRLPMPAHTTPSKFPQ